MLDSKLINDSFTKYRFDSVIHCAAIHTVLKQGILGQVYDIGGNNEKANLEIVQLIFPGTG